jgi:hypothetical protein
MTSVLCLANVSFGWPSFSECIFTCSRHYPPFIVHIGSCARPKFSPCLKRSLEQKVFSGCYCEPLLRLALPTLSLSIFRQKPGYVTWPRLWWTRFSPQCSALSRKCNEVDAHHTVRRLFCGYKHSLMLRDLALLATLNLFWPCTLDHTKGVAFTSEHPTVHYLSASRIY